MSERNNLRTLENLIEKAHKICSEMFLSEAVELDEDDVRLFLYCNRVTNHKLQDEYLEIVREYDMISGKKTYNYSGNI